MTEVKKGNAAWKPAHHLPLNNTPPGYRPKWCWDDPGNIGRLEAEGWLHPSQVPGGVEAEREDRKGINDGKNLTASEKKYRELRLMYLPEDVAKAREAYHAARTRKQTEGMKKNLQSDLNTGSNTPVNAQGKIIIE